jgi:hypothetical protein
MKKEINLRDILSIAVLLIAVLLFSVTVAFAQDKSDKEKKNEKVRIKIERMDGDKTVSFDTSFTLAEDQDLDDVLEKIGKSKNISMNSNSASASSRASASARRPRDKEGFEHRNIVLHFDYPDFSEKDKAQLKSDLDKAMRDLRESLEDMEKSLKDMHISIKADIHMDDKKDNDK